MSPGQSIIGIAGIKVEKVICINPLVIIAESSELASCPHCESKKVWKKDSFVRAVRHVSLGERRCYLKLRANKYHCQGCRKYFHTRFAGVLPYRRATESFRKEVFDRHHEGAAQSRLSAMLGIGAATIERWYQDFLKRFLSETLEVPCPQVMGIDEHFFSRKKGFATTIADLKSHRVYDVALGRSELSLKGFLSQLKGKERVKVVVMDLSETYRSIVKKYFTNAVIVADRFHVVRLIIHHFMKSWAQLEPEGRRNRGLVSLMRRHACNLKPEQVPRLAAYLKNYPVLKIVYEFKERLVQLMLIKHRTAKQCRQIIPQFLNAIEQLLQSPIEALQTLGASLRAWQDEIARMWRFTRTNSTLEGLHNKMEVISRRAYGFRNFENYRLRVKVLCGYSNRL